VLCRIFFVYLEHRTLCDLSHTTLEIKEYLVTLFPIPGCGDVTAIFEMDDVIGRTSQRIRHSQNTEAQSADIFHGHRLGTPNRRETGEHPRCSCEIDSFVEPIQ